MPQLPQNVTIVTKDNQPHRLEIDGAEFPWVLAQDSAVVQGVAIPESGVGATRTLYPEDSGPNPLIRVNVTILVDADRINFKEES